MHARTASSGGLSIIYYSAFCIRLIFIVFSIFVFHFVNVARSFDGPSTVCFGEKFSLRS
jgi:hypothetical protein